jgi:hypothetical protein
MEQFAERIASALERQVEQYEESVAKAEQRRAENLQLREQELVEARKTNADLMMRLDDALSGMRHLRAAFEDIGLRVAALEVARTVDAVARSGDRSTDQPPRA